MSQWANENPERMAEIALLPLDEQNAALREAMLGQLARGEPVADEQTLERVCRDCGDDFLIADRFALSTSKWTNLCPSCLMDEL